VFAASALNKFNNQAYFFFFFFKKKKEANVQYDEQRVIVFINSFLGLLG
jgi:hypothetical protein